MKRKRTYVLRTTGALRGVHDDGVLEIAEAIEVLSPSNTEKEMERKRKEYFFGGTRLVWIVDESKRTVEVWTSPDDCVTLTEGDTLDGGDLLPGFRVALKDIFVDPPRPARRRGKKPGGQKNSA